MTSTLTRYKKLVHHAYITISRLQGIQGSGDTVHTARRFNTLLNMSVGEIKSHGVTKPRVNELERIVRDADNWLIELATRRHGG